MAKNKSRTRISGTFNDVNYVDSKVYGPYLRSPRGTIKPAVINDTLKEMSGYIMKANVPAKLIQNALARYRENFKGGQMWQRLVSIFTAQQGNYNFEALTGFEIKTAHPLKGYMSFITDVTVDAEGSTMKVTLDYGVHPNFGKAEHVTGYTLQVVVIYPGTNMESAVVKDVKSPLISMESTVTPQHFEVPIPAQADTYLLCVKLEGWLDRFLMDGHTTKGMRVLKVGCLNRGLGGLRDFAD